MEALLNDIIVFIFKWGEWYIHNSTYLKIAFDLVIFYILLQITRMLSLLILTKKVSSKKMLFSRPNPGGKKILIAGDSTAVGTGASEQKDTIAGHLAQDFPSADILNVGVNGSLTRDLIKQLKPLTNTYFDVIIISTGGNDIWNFSFLGKIARDFRQALQIAKSMSGGKVIVLFFGNEGSAPFFPSLIRKLLMRRTKLVEEVFAKVTSEEKVDLIQLFDTTNSIENPFVANPKEYFAPDGLHPNSAGYWLWYKRMWYLILNKKYF